MDYGWFRNEVQERTKWCDAPPLVTTATDGDNGGWFRNATWEANFWGASYTELMDQARADTAGAPKPTFIEDYLDQFGTHGEVTVKTGAWNTGWHHGRDFMQWTGSQDQKDGWARMAAISAELHAARAKAEGSDDQALLHELSEALWRLLRAETSCNFFWGEDWVPRAHADLDEAERHTETARSLLER